MVDCSLPIPPERVETLHVRREGAGDLRFTWTELPTNPADYLLVSSASPRGPFEAIVFAPGGAPGAIAPMPAIDTFHLVAPLDVPGCLGLP